MDDERTADGGQNIKTTPDLNIQVILISCTSGVNRFQSLNYKTTLQKVLEYNIRDGHECVLPQSPINKKIKQKNINDKTHAKSIKRNKSLKNENRRGVSLGPQLPYFLDLAKNKNY